MAYSHYNCGNGSDRNDGKSATGGKIQTARHVSIYPRRHWGRKCNKHIQFCFKTAAEAAIEVGGKLFILEMAVSVIYGGRKKGLCEIQSFISLYYHWHSLMIERFHSSVWKNISGFRASLRLWAGLSFHTRLATVSITLPARGDGGCVILNAGHFPQSGWGV